MIQPHSSAGIAQNPMLSEAFYDVCIKFAKRIIYLEKANLFPEDIVHDLIIDTDINYGNYQNKIRNKIISEKNGFKPLSIETIYYKNPLPFKTNQDFTCTKCKDTYPDSEMYRYFSSKGFYVERNCCKKCHNETNSEYEKKARLLQLPSWFRKLERGREYYKKNSLVIRYKRKQRYHKLNQKKEKPIKVVIDMVKEKEMLSDIYIIKLLKRKFNISEITSEMILEKKNYILNPKPKKDIKQIRAEWNEKRKIKYRENEEYRERTKKKVSEYTKANKEKRKMSKLKLKESRAGF